MGVESGVNPLINSALEALPKVFEWGPPLIEVLPVAEKHAPDAMKAVMNIDARPKVTNEDGVQQSGPVWPHIRKAAETITPVLRNEAAGSEYVKNVQETGVLALAAYDVVRSIASTVVGIAKFVEPATKAH